jgi:hypothetical protein
VVEKADVEAAHRDAVVWGGKAQVFDPRRFTSEPRHALFAFGVGQLSCIASSWAPMAAAVIVSSVLKAMTDLNLEITAGRELGGRSGWEGWKIDKKIVDHGEFKLLYNWSTVVSSWSANNVWILCSV